MNPYLASTVEKLPGFKSFFDYYTALKVAGWHAFGRRKTSDSNGIPIPPPFLLISTTGTADVSVYLDSGALAFESIRHALSVEGRDATKMRSVLDFGCGCGRVLRQWHSLSAVTAYGVDVDRRAVKWCRTGLPFAQTSICAPEPPLHYPDQEFDLIYALSVLTHLTEAQQNVWVREWHRLLKPKGVLIFSLHGSYYRDTLSAEEREAFDTLGIVVRYPGSSGTNRCGSYHSLSFVTGQLTAGYDLLQHIPCGARGNPQQDLYVLCKHAL